LRKIKLKSAQKANKLYLTGLWKVED